ncbi:YwmB family TATA-box binding protein [Bacillus pacificus]
MSGAKWDPKYIQKTNKIFSEKPIIYTCVQGALNDKIEGVLQNKANQGFERSFSKSDRTDRRKSMLCQSPHTIKSGMTLFQQIERKINVQIAIRSTDNKDTIVVGTPIITSEY